MESNWEFSHPHFSLSISQTCPRQHNTCGAVPRSDLRSVPPSTERQKETVARGGADASEASEAQDSKWSSEAKTKSQPMECAMRCISCGRARRCGAAKRSKGRARAFQRRLLSVFAPKLLE